MSIAISVNDLKKSYGNNLALKGISFDIKQGEIFALLGVNGAGKTTTLECIEGLLKYDEGSIRVDGKTGIQLQSSSLPDQIKSFEAICLFEMWNNSKADANLIKDLGIEDISKKKYCQLSTGQKRRLHLALALVSQPDIIFLDEPTAGLDVEGRIALHQQIRELKKAGKTIVLASHDMAEVEMLSDRIAIIESGNIAFIGTVNEIEKQVNKQYYIEVETKQGRDYIVIEDLGSKLLELLSDYNDRGLSIVDIKISRGSLEQQFVKFTRRNG